MFSLKHSKFLAGFLILVFSLSGCASRSGKTTTSPASSKELAAGNAIHEQILTDFKPYTNPALNSYLQEIVDKLSSHAKRKKLNYRVTILNDERIYAISAPGGQIYITTAFLTFVNNEAELAAVLGHEIGELQFLSPQFDPIRKTVDGVTKAGQIVGPLFGQVGALATLGLIGLHAAYARDPDLDTRIASSDVWVMKTMTHEGYDPQALIDVLSHFAKYDRQLLSMFYDYYQSRPITVKRVHRASDEFKKINLEGLDLQTFFERYKKNTENLHQETSS